MLIQRTLSSNNIKYQTALVEFNEGKLEKVYKTCQSLDNDLKDRRTDEEKENWTKLKERVIEAIAQKRETSPHYAPNVILPTLSTVPVTERTIENPKPPVSSPKDVLNKEFWGRCINYVKSGELHRVSDLCEKQTLQLSVSEDQDNSSFLEDIKPLQTCLQHFRDQYLAQARKCSQSELERTAENTLKREFWTLINRKIAYNIQVARVVMDRFLNPKPQTRINWDRFAEPVLGKFFPYMNRDVFPELYDIASKGKEAVESQIKRQLVILACTTIILTFAIPFALYSNGYISDYEAKLISPFIAAMYMLLSCAYCIFTATFAEERVVAEIRAMHNSIKKEI